MYVCKCKRRWSPKWREYIVYVALNNIDTGLCMFWKGPGSICHNLTNIYILLNHKAITSFNQNVACHWHPPIDREPIEFYNHIQKDRSTMSDHIHFSSVLHYNDVTIGLIASHITSLTIVYSAVYSDADQRKHLSPASLAFVRGFHRGPVASNAEYVSIWWRHHDRNSTGLSLVAHQPLIDMMWQILVRR